MLPLLPLQMARVELVVRAVQLRVILPALVVQAVQAQQAAQPI
jgi:hypothetical protein